MCHSYWACALEPGSHDYWALGLRAHVLQQAKPSRHKQRKPAGSNEDPVQPKINKQINNKMKSVLMKIQWWRYWIICDNNNTEEEGQNYIKSWVASLIDPWSGIGHSTWVWRTVWPLTWFLYICSLGWYIWFVKTCAEITVPLLIGTRPVWKPALLK